MKQLKLVCKVTGLALAVAIFAGCMSEENVVAQPISNDDQIAHIQNNPNMPDDVKQQAIARLKQGQASGKSIDSIKKN